MATQRTTFNKRDRERAKQAKATAKRARRAEKSDADAIAAPVARDDDGLTDDELIGKLRELHDAFDNERISYDAFETEKALLLDRIAKRI